MNRLGQRGPTMHGWHADVFRDRAQAFGWHAIEIDGHDVDAIDRAYRDATRRRPAHADRGADREGSRRVVPRGPGGVARQGRPRRPAERGDRGARRRSARSGARRPRPTRCQPARVDAPGGATRPAYDAAVATRKAFGETLAWLAGHRPDVVVARRRGRQLHLHRGRRRRSRPSGSSRCTSPSSAWSGVQTGLQALGQDGVRGHVRGVPGARGRLQSGWARSAGRTCVCAARTPASRSARTARRRWRVEDLALFRALHGSTVLYPADGNDAVAARRARCATSTGISYLRTTREATPALYGADEAFPVGGSKTLASSDHDDVTLVGAGITLHECLAAADLLAADGVTARVLDCYSVKPIDAVTLRAALDETGLDGRRRGPPCRRAASATPCSTRSPRPVPCRVACVKLARHADARVGDPHGAARVGRDRRGRDRGRGPPEALGR